jgi:23S rRNA G2069 N7-methylase RlmK/C1962 C5-methylase RlmI
LEFLEDPLLAQALFEADRRFRLFSWGTEADQCFRLVHGKSSLKDNNFSIDLLGDRLLLAWYKESMNETEQKRFTRFAEDIGKPLVVRLPHSQLVLNQQSAVNNLDSVWQVKETPLCFELRSQSGAFVGLSPLQRLQRNWVRQNAIDKSTLVLFAQTCSFAVAAKMGQAKEITSVDSNKNLLNWGRRNFEINGIDLELEKESCKFLCRESMAFLKQAVSKKAKFDLVVCEAPSFLRGEKGVFKIDNDLEALLSLCLEVLAPQGKLLFSTTFEGFFVDDVKKAILKVQKSLKISNLQIYSIQPAFDLELPYEKAQLKSFLIEV